VEQDRTKQEGSQTEGGGWKNLTDYDTREGIKNLWENAKKKDPIYRGVPPRAKRERDSGESHPSNRPGYAQKNTPPSFILVRKKKAVRLKVNSFYLSAPRGRSEERGNLWVGKVEEGETWV